jgi:hypothetical protein
MPSLDISKGGKLSLILIKLNMHFYPEHILLPFHVALYFVEELFVKMEKKCVTS